MMTRDFTYAGAGVDRKLRAKSKEGLKMLSETYKFSSFGPIVHLPYGKIFPINKNRYLDLVIEGVGTKVLLAQLAESYDTIGIDAVAMAVNDVIRSGATPLAIADNVHAQVSDPKLTREWLKGIAKGADEAGCPVTGGEIGDVNEVIRGLTEGTGFDMIVAAVGQVPEEKIIDGKNIESDDLIIGLRSSGLHSNGISLARKILFKQWGGRYEADEIIDGLNKEVVYEVLEPTRIYVKPLLEIAKTVRVKAAVHITGDAYLKFKNLSRFSPGIGFRFHNLKPQPIFKLIQETAKDLGGAITDEEMFRTFNMGWGFAVIIDRIDEAKAISVFEKAGTQSERIGKVTKTGRVEILHEDKRIVLD